MVCRAAAILLIGLALRLHGIHNPLLDHPGWRQGDTAAIARNFARLQFDILRPQTMYDGPPPNYVELELQIVPFIAAALYKVFGIHEVFGRLLSVAFSLATVATVAYFARWLFAGAIAGLLAAFFYAVFPGSVYYGRTFMPDAAMVFFLTAALYACARYLTEDDRLAWRGLAWPTALLALAYLAKPVAVLALAPVAGMLWQRLRARRASPALPVAMLIAVPLLTLWLYDRRVASYAEWHWTSGITRLHVLPALMTAFEHAAAFAAKASQFSAALGMLPGTMLGKIAFGLSILSFAALPWVAARSRALLWGWLAGGIAYAYVVVTVERVDYYLYPLLPLCALASGGALARYVRAVRGADAAPIARYALIALVPLVAFAVLVQGRGAVAAYYRYDKQVYRNAAALNAALPKDAIVVIGHYGPERAILRRPLWMGGRPGAVDAVRRRERDPQRGSVLHLDRGSAHARQQRPVRLAAALPGADGPWAVADLPNGSGPRVIARRRVVARISQGAARGERPGVLQSPRRVRGYDYGPIALNVSSSDRNASGSTAMLPRYGKSIAITRNKTMPIIRLRAPTISCCMIARSKPKKYVKATVK